jgi:hypothetical protein
MYPPRNNFEPQITSLMKPMQIFHFKALSNDRYTKDCHSEALRMHINGGLTIVGEAYFHFGLSLMKVIVNVLMQQNIKYEGDNAYLKNAQKCVQKQE